MTTQKKLLAFGAVTGILLTAFIFLPDGLKGKSLQSASVTDPTCDTQTTKVFSIADL